MLTLLLVQRPETLTQGPVIDEGGHAADQLAARAAHLRAAHSLCTLVAAVALIILLPAVGGWISCVEHLHGGVSRHEGNLEKTT